MPRFERFFPRIKSAACTKLAILLFIAPVSVQAECHRPFLSTKSFEVNPTHAGLALPIPTDLFSFSDCPESAKGTEAKCLVSISIDNGEFPPTVAYLIYSPQSFDLSTLIEADKATVIETAKDGSSITAFAFQFTEKTITRIDKATNGNKTFMLSVNHNLHENYPQIEILQSFIRENIVICGSS